MIAGVTTCWHRLKGIVERYYILRGKGVMGVGDLPPREVEEGDVVIIPAMCRQRIKNIGQGDLVFLASCDIGKVNLTLKSDVPVNVKAVLLENFSMSGEGLNNRQLAA